MRDKMTGGAADPATQVLTELGMMPSLHWVCLTSKSGEAVSDPFVDSGTCAIAAVTEARRF